MFFARKYQDWRKRHLFDRDPANLQAHFAERQEISMDNRFRRITPAGIFESVFDIAYLTFVFITAAVFYLQAHGSVQLILCGTLALILGGGDSFHLIPRVKRALRGEDDRTEKFLGLGLLISSVTMTVFYLVLYEIWKIEFPETAGQISAGWVVLLFASAFFRIVICLLPQNNWFHKEGNARFSLLRNLPFALTGAIVCALFFMSGNEDGLRMWRMSIAIIISFACYFPVTLLSKKKPAIGMLMIPKTCAYIWMMLLLVQLL